MFPPQCHPWVLHLCNVASPHNHLGWSGGHRSSGLHMSYKTDVLLAVCWMNNRSSYLLPVNRNHAFRDDNSWYQFSDCGRGKGMAVARNSCVGRQAKQTSRVTLKALKCHFRKPFQVLTWSRWWFCKLGNHTTLSLKLPKRSSMYFRF